MAVRASSMSPPVEDAAFHTWMAAAFLLVAFGGFAPTYWMQLPAGTFVGAPIVHLHGALFSLWPIFLLSQARLAAQGRLRAHRSWGLAGIGLASAMVVIGVAVAIGTLQHGLAKGYGDASREFFLVPLMAMALFAGFVVAAIIRRADRGWHQRLMLLATISVLQAAVGRVLFLMATGGGPGLRPGLGPPPPVLMPTMAGLLLELFIVAGMVHDWRRHGRPHPAWVAGAAIITAALLVRPLVARSQAWHDFASFMAGFAG